MIMETTNKKDGKILFVVGNYRQYHTYIKTKVFKEIEDRLVFLVHQGLSHIDFGVSKDRIFFYTYPSRKDTFHRHVFNINTWQNKRRNVVFQIRTLAFTRRQLRAYSILSLPILSNIVKFIYLKRAEDKNLFELIKKINPSLIILPSHAFEGLTFELIKIAKRINIPSFMLTNNWDTLANKTIFTIKPDYLGVWSQQHVEHALNVKNMSRDRIFILGAPRFVNYVRPENKRQSSPYPFRYILYAGITEPFNELGVLKIIDDIIDRQKIDLKVVYRPNVTQHTRKCPDVFFDYDYKHVILDVPSRIFYKRSASWEISQKDVFNPIYYPDSDYFLKLLSNMEFMISPQTTMILEATLFDKRNYILACDDGIHRFNPKWTFENITHLKDVKRLKNVRMVNSFDEIEKIFSPGDELKRPVEPLDIDYFISKEKTANYSTNLKKVIDIILSK